MQYLLRRRLGLLAFALLAGCATQSEQNAMRLTRETLAQVMEYDSIVQKWSSDSVKAYDKQFDQIRKRIAIQENVDFQSSVNQKANDLADKAEVRLIRDIDVRTFVMDVLSEEAAMMSSMAASIADLEKDRNEILAKLKFQRAKLKTARAKLEQLQLPPSLQDRISQLKVVYETSRATYRQLQENDARADGGG